MKFNHGDIVRWTKEMAQNEAERAMFFICLEPTDDGKCYIKQLGSELDFAPAQFVKQEWLELAQ